MMPSVCKLTLICPIFCLLSLGECLQCRPASDMDKKPVALLPSLHGVVACCSLMEPNLAFPDLHGYKMMEGFVGAPRRCWCTCSLIPCSPASSSAA